MQKSKFKELFLKLTEYTIPFGEESIIEYLLPNGYKRDSVGNYYYEIGNSETLFTTHLDTYSKKKEKVNHVIEDYKISTDGTTILGGDNKLGTTILISMIEDGVPGTYYFFLGEEPILSGGVWGSTNALNKNPDFFKRFKRCIAFDRKGYGSIVVRQMGRMCCSTEFAKSISNHFDINGIKWDSESSFGYYTDSAVFMDVIPECTNISAGGFNEHSKEEWVDLNYTYKVYQIAKDMNWEDLPVVRELEERFKDLGNSYKFSKYKENLTCDKVDKILSFVDLQKTRKVQTKENTHLTYSKWLEDYDLDIYINDEEIKIEDDKMELSEFKIFIVRKFLNEIITEIYYSRNDSKFLNKFKSVFGEDIYQKVINLVDSIIEEEKKK